MALDQLDLIKNQTQAAARTQAAGAAAKLRAETSLVGQASRLIGRMAPKADQLADSAARPRRAGGVRTEKDTLPEPPRPVKPAPDGYVRRSTVQPIRVPADYRRRIIRRIAGGTVLGVGVLVVVWLLLQSNLLAY